MRKIFFISALLFSAIALNLYFRSVPMAFPQLRQLARFNVEQTLRQRSAELVKNQFPDLSEASRRTLSAAAYADYLRNNRAKVAAQQQDEYLKLVDPFQDARGQTYLMELDCWEWARMVENILANGHHGTRLVNGQPYDDFSLAPAGRPAPWISLLFSSSAWLYRLVNSALPMPLQDFLFYLPLFHVVVLIVLVFFICQRNYGLLAAWISCLVLGLAPIILPRTCAGWFDTDVLNLLFPVAIVYAYLMVYERSTFIQRLLWVAAAAVLVGLFSWTWPWWWFICAVIVVYEVFKIVDLFSEQIQYKEQVGGLVIAHLYCLGLFLGLAALCVLLMPGSRAFLEVADQVKSTLRLNDALAASIWPNVYSTVGELRRPDFFAVVRMVGGFAVFLCATASMLFLIVRNRGFKGLKRESLFLLVIWFMGSLLASFKGVRLTVFLLVPMAVPLGWAFQELFDAALARRAKVLFGIVCCAAGALACITVTNAQTASRQMYPLMDDSWYGILSTVREQAPADAIVNSWWDYGDWFKTAGGRRVIFDGQSQNVPQAYWMAKALLATSEDQAIALLRMLNNGGNRAFELIDSRVQNPLRSVMLLEKALTLDRGRAAELLSPVLGDGLTGQVLGILFDRPGTALFIVDESMVNKIQPISSIGSWDFARMYAAKNIRQGREAVLAGLAQLGVDAQRADLLCRDAELLSGRELESWISRQLRFYSDLVPGQEKSGRVFFNNGMVFDPQAGSIDCFDVGSGSYRTPKKLFIFRDTRLASVQEFQNAGLPMSVAVFADAQGYKALVLDDQLVESLFTRLYFLKGVGSRHFRLFAEKERDGRVIRVFEIDWEPAP